MNFYTLGAIALTVGAFTETDADIVLSEVECNGSEPNLLGCGHEDLMHVNCGPLEDAGVVCQCKSAANTSGANTTPCS